MCGCGLCVLRSGAPLESLSHMLRDGRVCGPYVYQGPCLDEKREIMKTDCQDQTHIFKPFAKPGDLCACGKSVWITRTADKPAKSEGAQAVDEPLQK